MIEGYHFGRITIDGASYKADVIVYADRVDSHWWRQEGHRVSLDDLKDVVKVNPETLVIGTGYFGMMKVDPEVPEVLGKQGIAVIVEKTGEACKEFNRLRSTGKVVAALHLTC